MKIYKISQSVNNGYDTYDSAIVIAKNETDARKISPDNYRHWSDKNETWMFTYADDDIEEDRNFDTWVNNLELMEALNSRGFNFISTKSVLSGRFELDGYDETRKLAVEYCGIHWHSEKRGRDRNYHYKKWKECYDKGIKLYTIFCDEWRESKNKIIDFITNPEIKIYARKTEFKEVPKGIAQKFCDDYHIESSAGVKFAYGLYYNNELCSVMTFENHHRNFKKLTMNRFCTKSNMIIIGGASKIMSNVYNIIQEPIITWSDNRWSDGDVYKKMGCKYDGILKPEYSWVKGKNRFSKQSRSKKRTGQPMHMTEKEYNESLDMSRIWDCGKIRWIYEGK